MTLSAWLPSSLIGRFAAVAGLMILLLSALSWPLLQRAIRGPAAMILEERMATLARELRGDWIAAEIAQGEPRGSGTVDFLWQIEVEGSQLYRSDLLAFEDIELPRLDGLGEEFRNAAIETPLGLVHLRQRELEEDIKSIGDNAADFPPRKVIYSVAISDSQRERLIASYSAPLSGAILWIFAALLLALALLVAALSLVIRPPLQRLEQALGAYRQGQTQNLEGSYPAEIEKLVQSLNQTLKASDSLAERTRRYIGKMGHDLKHPIAIALGALGPGKGENERELAKGRLQGMTGLIDRYITMARTLGPGHTRSLIALAPLLDDAKAGFSVLYRRQPLTIETICEAGLQARIARADLETIISNLITNAHKYAGSRARIEARGENGALLIRIEDDGSGLNQDQRDKALNWGERLDTTPPGEGFGLAIVKDLAELYDGQVSLGASALGGLGVEVTLKVEVRNSRP